MSALHDIVKKGSTDRSVAVRIVDSADGTPETGVVFNTSGIDLWYRREGAAVVSITEATLAALTTAHADGGFLHVSNGIYRLDLPDAAFATGANYVDFGGTVTGMVVIGGRVRLVDYDPEDAVRAGLTALPNANAAATGGLLTCATTGNVLPSAAIIAASFASDAITAAKLASDVGAEIADAVWDEILSGHVVAGSAGARLYSPYTATLTAGSATGGTFPSGGAVSSVDNFYNNAIAIVIAGTGAGQFRVIDDYVGSTRVWTVATGDDFTTALDNTSVVMIVPGVSSTGSGGSGPTAAEIADAVWDEDATGHQTQGTFGQAIGDPGADTDTIWALVNTNLNATISSRASQTSLDTVDDLLDTEVAAIFNRIGAPVGASISADIAAVKTQTAAIETDTQDIQTRLPAALVSGRMDSSVGAMAANVLTAAATAADFGAEVADAVLDEVVEGTITLRQFTRGFGAALLGEVSGAATTTMVFRDASDTKTRITATVDSDGNRTALTLDLT
jgi:hypothetical protein